MNQQDKQVLLCEDHPINQEIAARILERVGMIVTKANNGKEAVEVFNKVAPDFFRVIIMDIRMPIMNGLEATKAIRALDREDAKNIPIIAMSKKKIKYYHFFPLFQNFTYFLYCITDSSRCKGTSYILRNFSV